MTFLRLIPTIFLTLAISACDSDSEFGNKDTGTSDSSNNSSGEASATCNENTPHNFDIRVQDISNGQHINDAIVNLTINGSFIDDDDTNDDLTQSVVITLEENLVTGDLKYTPNSDFDVKFKQGIYALVVAKDAFKTYTNASIRFDNSTDCEKDAPIVKLCADSDIADCEESTIEL